LPADEAHYVLVACLGRLQGRAPGHAHAIGNYSGSVFVLFSIRRDHGRVTALEGHALYKGYAGRKMGLKKGKWPAALVT
jgi:hypothetical protein